MPALLPTTAPAAPIDLPTARAECIAATITGKASPALRAWLADQIREADETEETAVGHLRCALFHANEADCSWRLIAHAGRELAEALHDEGKGRASRYGFQVGSAGQASGT